MSLDTDKTAALREALEKRILHGLSSEWEVALWGLSETHRKSMRKPLFSLRDMTRNLGQWDPGKREITLSRALIMNHPWQAVRDVLHHEMAHQMAHEVLGGKAETAHGDKFREACRLLRISPDATGTYERIESIANPGASDGILLKIKKLFALAESPNPHEAEAAMLKAHQLIFRHNIDLLDLKKERRFVSLLVGPAALRHTRDRYDLANLIQDFYFVQGVWVPVYVLEKAKMGRALEVSGTRENVEMASYVYDYITHYIDAQWQVFNGGNGNGRRRKIDFAQGVLNGFRRKLTPPEKGRVNGKNERAVVSLEDPQLGRYLKHRYPHIRSFRRQGAGVDPGAMKAGIVAGQSLVIAKGIRETGKQGRLLTGG